MQPVSPIAGSGALADVEYATDATYIATETAGGEIAGHDHQRTA